MKSLAIIFALLVITPAAAQQLPRTVIMNDAKGKQVGTGTISGNRMYVRDLKGKHIVTIMVEADGTQTLFDPSGNVIEKRSAPQ